MCANTDQNSKFRLQRSMPVIGVVWLLPRLQIRVRQQADESGILQDFQRIRRPIDDEDRVAAPFEDDLLSCGE